MCHEWPFGAVGGTSIGTSLDVRATLTWAFIAERVTRVGLASQLGNRSQAEDADPSGLHRDR